MFAVYASDRKQKHNLDVNSPPPEAYYSSVSKKNAQQRLKELKKTHNKVVMKVKEY